MVASSDDIECADESDDFSGSTEPDSEELTDDADAENDPAHIESVIEDIMATMGWEQTRISGAIEAYRAQAAAVDHLDTTNHFSLHGNSPTGPLPTVMLMLDGGTFQHMIGIAAMNYAVNIRKVEPFPVRTAGGVV